MKTIRFMRSTALIVLILGFSFAVVSPVIAWGWLREPPKPQFVESGAFGESISRYVATRDWEREVQMLPWDRAKLTNKLALYGASFGLIGMVFFTLFQVELNARARASRPPAPRQTVVSPPPPPKPNAEVPLRDVVKQAGRAWGHLENCTKRIADAFSEGRKSTVERPDDEGSDKV